MTSEPDGLRRVREPVSRSQSTVQGKVADVFAGRSRHAESQNELKAFRVLMATGVFGCLAGAAVCLEYHHEGTHHRYTPDILVAWGAHQEVVEIKADSDAELPENQAPGNSWPGTGFTFGSGRNPRFALNPAWPRSH